MYQQSVFDFIAPVSPSDADNLPNAGVLYIGGAGNIRVDLINGVTVTVNGLTAGTILPVKVVKVHSTSTTATNIAVLY